MYLPTFSLFSSNLEGVKYTSKQVTTFGMLLMAYACHMFLAYVFIISARGKMISVLQCCSWTFLLLFVCHFVGFAFIIYLVLTDDYDDGEDSKSEGGRYLFKIGVVGFLYLVASLSGFSSIKEIRIHRQKIEAPLTNHEMDAFESILFEKLVWLNLYKRKKIRGVTEETDMEVQSLP